MKLTEIVLSISNHTDKWFVHATSLMRQKKDLKNMLDDAICDGIN